MSFNSLSKRHNIELPEFSVEWLPLIHCYDPDPSGFAAYPDPSHGGSAITVEEFIRTY